MFIYSDKYKYSKIHTYQVQFQAQQINVTIEMRNIIILGAHSVH